MFPLTLPVRFVFTAHTVLWVKNSDEPYVLQSSLQSCRANELGARPWLLRGHFHVVAMAVARKTSAVASLGWASVAYLLVPPPVPVPLFGTC